MERAIEQQTSRFSDLWEHFIHCFFLNLEAIILLVKSYKKKEVDCFPIAYTMMSFSFDIMRRITLHTAVARVVRAAVKTELSYRNDTIIAFFVVFRRSELK